jgi:hypothetical protein
MAAFAKSWRRGIERHVNDAARQRGNKEPPMWQMVALKIILLGNLRRAGSVDGGQQDRVSALQRPNGRDGEN